MERLVILDDYQNVALSMADWTPLESRVAIAVRNDHIGDRKALVEALQGASLIMAMRERTPFDADLFAKLPDLKLLVTTGMANRSIDMKAAASHGVTVCGATGGGGFAAAEMAWALLMALARQVSQEDARFHGREPQWQQFVGQELKGRTLGLVGFGKLARRMARYAEAFEMPVLAWSRSLTDVAAAEAGVARAGSIMDVMKGSDFVSVHLTLTDETRGMIGPAELAAMKPAAYLVNTARGPIVDEQALISALREGRIAGAGLDVFDIEPLPLDHPLRTLSNVIATPHTGYVTEETYGGFFGSTVEAIDAYLRGAPVRVLNG